MISNREASDALHTYQVINKSGQLCHNLWHSCLLKNQSGVMMAAVSSGQGDSL